MGIPNLDTSTASSPSCGPPPLRAIQEVLGYTFKNELLLQRALTHSSWANERDDDQERHNERLEFLGDSILDMIIAERLFRRNPDAREGALTRRRSQLVSSKGLLRVAESIDLFRYLRLGKGELKTGGRVKEGILTDAIEALIAAVYLDGGIRKTRSVVLRLFKEELKAPLDETPITDYLSRLQEHCQNALSTVPKYRMVEESGPAHDRTFRMEALVSGQRVGLGEGCSKKAAKQQAARQGLIFFKVLSEDTAGIL